MPTHFPRDRERLSLAHLTLLDATPLVCGNDPDESRVTANFAALCEAARPLGLKAMLEFIPFCHTRTPAEALRVVQAAAQPNAGVLVDALHLTRSGGSPDDLRGLIQRSSATGRSAMRLPSPPADGDLRTEARTRRLYPGEGELPLAAMLDVLPADIPSPSKRPAHAYAHLSVCRTWPTVRPGHPRLPRTSQLAPIRQTT